MSDIVEEEPPAPPDNTFVHSPVGLYPVPIGRSTKFSAISKVKNKFRFLGKLLAKSAMDGRMVSTRCSYIQQNCSFTIEFIESLNTWNGWLAQTAQRFWLDESKTKHNGAPKNPCNVIVNPEEKY